MTTKVENIRHAIVSTDIVLFAFKEETLYAVVIKVKNDEYAGKKAFPGALILPDETALDSVKRVIDTKLDLNHKNIYFEELGAYSDVGRDVRGRVVSVAFIGLTDYENLESHESNNFEIIEVKKIKGLAYDHDKMLSHAILRLQEKFSNTTIAQKLLSNEFTSLQLFTLYCTVLNKKLDKRNFMRKIKALKIIKQGSKVVRGQKHRPAKLFEFKNKKVEQLEIF